MGVMPVNRLLITMSVPMIISMLVQSLYNIVDSMFVAQINQAALTAVGLAFPMQNLMISVAIGTSVGISAFLSRSLGEKDFTMVSKIAGNGIFLAAVSTACFMLIGIFFIPIYFRSQIDDPVIIQYGYQYLFYICILSVSLFGQVTFTRFLIATGQTLFSMVTQAVGALVNVFLDYCMIFGHFGFPAMGVSGAAIATVIGRFVAAGVGIYFNLKFNKEIAFSLQSIRPDWTVIKRIYSVGLPSIIMQSITSIMTFGMNRILMVFSATATTLFSSIYIKIQSFVFFPVFGLNNASVPIVAYNYGAKKKKRMIDTIRLAVLYAMSMMLIGLAIFQIIPQTLLGMFNPTPEMIEIGVPALRILSLCFLFAGYNVICSSVFQALGEGVLSMMVSIIRQLLVLLPTAYLLSLTGNLTLVWFCMPISEVAALIFVTIFLVHTYHKIIEPIPSQ